MGHITQPFRVVKVLHFCALKHPLQPSPYDSKNDTFPRSEEMFAVNEIQAVSTFAPQQDCAVKHKGFPQCFDKEIQTAEVHNDSLTFGPASLPHCANLDFLKSENHLIQIMMSFNCNTMNTQNKDFVLTRKSGNIKYFKAKVLILS